MTSLRAIMSSQECVGPKIQGGTLIMKRDARTICVRLLKASRNWREKIWRGIIVIRQITRREASGGKPDIWRIDDIAWTGQDDKRNAGSKDSAFGYIRRKDHIHRNWIYPAERIYIRRFHRIGSGYIRRDKCNRRSRRIRIYPAGRTYQPFLTGHTMYY